MKLKPILSLLAATLFVVPSAMATCIAWDGSTLACDSQMTYGHRREKCRSKIYKINGHLVGCAGRVSQINNFIEWFKDQSKPFPTFDEAQALVIRPDGTSWVYQGDNNPIEVCGKVAIGSGSDFALGAMEAGADSVEAIRVAEALDIYCGGEIKSLKLDGAQ